MWNECMSNVPVNPAESEPGICDKARGIHEMTKAIMKNTYLIKHCLIGIEPDEDACNDLQVSCLEEELNQIEAKLHRTAIVINSIGKGLGISY